VSQLSTLQLSFGRAAAEGKSFCIAFDRAYQTQALIHSFLSQGQLCDPPLVKALTDFLVPGDTFIDVGSHIGYLSLLALQMVGPAGQVYAFEPNPDTYGVLVANALLNGAGNFHTFNCAVGDKAGSAVLSINAQDEGMSSLVFHAAGASQISVHVTTLDRLAALVQFRHVRMLKIDVEGFEENVINGAAGMLRAGGIESLVFEVNNKIPHAPPHRDQAIRKFLHGLGYACYLIHPWLSEERWQEACGPHNYCRISEDAHIDIGYGNILATKRHVEAAP